MNNKLVIGTVIGLIVGLALGVFIGISVSAPNNGSGINNQVQVSGSVKEQNPNEISFSSIQGSKQSVQTSSLITNGQFSVVLVGNQSYNVEISFTNGYDSVSYSIYVPTGANTFTANF